MTMLAALIDDAGLFPPARKPMAQAVADHSAERKGPNAWLLGRFLCPASRLQEFAHTAPDADGWLLGIVLDGRGEDWLDVARGDLERIRAYPGPAAIRAVEVPLPAVPVTPDTVRGFVEAVAGAKLPYPVDAFLEVHAHDERQMVGSMRAIAAVRPTDDQRSPGAKIRCGGATADLFPTSAQIAAFIREARRLAIPFKATAGLHHPFRVRDESVGVVQHGFVNLLAATALAVPDLEPVIDEARAEAFEVDAGSLRWGEHAADADALARARSMFTAYGSCSFDEPVDDLTAHGILPVRPRAASLR